MPMTMETSSMVFCEGTYKKIICKYSKQCKNKRCEHRVLHIQDLITGGKCLGQNCIVNGKNSFSCMYY